ncbi:uncharacterized protein PAC_01957 [Phialocephala subalpina]|uniref:DUF7587 domain-containing protein n=1 Tax=Phialocephala subalpina TaxID=576137 RepID=A0A1L7WH29_9HELO|nr:uncharacterized protein PAC_01957 [Phialocephala subalpina]
MDEYVCSTWDLPNKLYRVHYPGSRTTFTSQHGFTASDVTKVFRSGELSDFKSALEKQFTWGCRDPLPFISLFSDKRHAENWGRKEPWSEHKDSEGNWALHVVNGVELRRTTHIFRLSDLVKKLSLKVPESARQHIQGAFICLHRIPASAIVESRSPAEIEHGKYTDVDIDTWDYLGDYGDNDSDREMLQENYNTIFEKNIEDNW